MNNLTYVGKAAVIGGVLVASMVGLSMVQDLNAARQVAGKEVASNIEDAAGGPYQASTPMLGVVVRERWPDAVAGTELQAYREYLLMPSQLQLAVTSSVETRYRGMFPGRISTTKQVATATFASDEGVLRAAYAGGQVDIVEAYVVVGLASARGVTQIEGALATGGTLRFADRGAALDIASAVLNRQLIAPISDRALVGFGPLGSPLEVSVTLDAVGGDRVTLVPMGAANTVTLQTNWPHLSYAQRLPTTRTVGAQGSSATWRFGGSAAGHKPYYDREEAGLLAEAMAASGITAAFVAPVDLYSSLDRAVKYGWLIVLVTLGLVLFYDHTRAMHLHPVQYGAIAAALVIFFVLLLSLGEHVGFLAAYAVAAATTCALCGGYLGAIFGRLGLGAGFAGYFAGAYVALYIILRSEDYALLLGAALLLLGLAVTMWLTRSLHRAPAATADAGLT